MAKTKREKLATDYEIKVQAACSLRDLFYQTGNKRYSALYQEVREQADAAYKALCEYDQS